MRYVWLVALREFGENARTKGFWIGIISFPIIIALSFVVMDFIKNKATPTRHFVLVDQSGEFEEVIEKQLVRFQTRKDIQEFQEYALKYARKPESMSNIPDLERVPADKVSIADQLDGILKSNPDELDRRSTEEGWNEMVARTEVLLKEDRPEFERPKIRFQRVDLPVEVSPDAELATLVEELKPYLVGDEKFMADGEEEQLFAAVLIPEDVQDYVTRGRQAGAMKDAQEMTGTAPEKGRGIEYWSVNLTDTDLRDEIQEAVDLEVQKREYVQRDIDEKLVDQVRNTHVDFTSLNPKKEEGEEEVSMADVIRQWAPVGFVYLLWISIFQVAMMLLNNTIEEKSNRIIEVLLSSVTPWELMMGKLLGIAMVGLTMMTAWIASLVGLLVLKRGPEAEWAGYLFEVISEGGFLVWFGIYFVLGYLMYAGLFLAIGSICNTIKEAQNFISPVMVIMMVPLLTMMFIPRDPNGTLATVLSWVPLYTPFVMMNRTAADPPVVDMVGTLILMVVTTVFMLWLSGKIFRTGILRTGQPPRLLELFRWVRSK